ncbi:MAG TPA: acyltransferase family protein, partial [Glaciihabitans sp.]|nr:acyltransferase family protein [Glaciihabitans sp.]
MSSSPGSAPATRLNSLDGLRGIAALVVVFYHLSLVARPFLDTGHTGDVWWWLTETPLKVFTLGTESVLVFFVLSGV